MTCFLGKDSFCESKLEIGLKTNNELAVCEGKLCPQALGQQSIKLSHQNERLTKIPLLNNDCHTLCILHDVS